MHSKFFSNVPERSDSIGIGDTSCIRNLRLFLWGIAVLFGFLQAWNNRHFMNSDGISYLDLADAYLSGGWKMLLNGHWSPLYPWLLAVARYLAKPSPYWEFTLLHLVNFLSYVFALTGFEFMLRELIATRTSDPDSSDANPALPEWALYLIGYLVFLWLSLSLITLERESPDMLMSGFVYLAMAIIFKIRNGSRSLRWPALLGLTLGLGYLAKAPMFPLAFVFLGVAMFSSRHPARSLRPVLIALVIFLLVSAPLLIGLSRVKGRLTFGDSGKYNYLSIVNQAGPGWYMDTLGTALGKFQHPPQKIFGFPTVYAFVGPVGGTLPVWYDPSYWIEGAKPHLVWHRQLTVILGNAGVYFDLLFSQQVVLMAVFLLLWVAGQPSASRHVLARLWPAWVPAFAALGMYLLILVDQRYVAAFLIVLWVALFASLRLDSAESRKLVLGAAIALLFTLGVPLALSAAEDFRQGIHRPNPQWEVAQDLRLLGIQPGSEVGRIGGLHRVEWARLLRVRVIAEVPRDQEAYFWSSSQSVQLQVVESFRKVGAVAIVAEEMPPDEVFVPPPGWQRIGHSGFYAYLLKTQPPPAQTR